MSESYDVVIIGGGIIGAAVAYHLAKNNFGKIAVVERDQYLGNCSTAKCAGGIRAQFSSEINVRMSLLSEDRVRDLRTGHGYRRAVRSGRLFVCSNQRRAGNDFPRTVRNVETIGHAGTVVVERRDQELGAGA